MRADTVHSQCEITPNGIGTGLAESAAEKKKTARHKNRGADEVAAMMKA